MNGAMVLAGLLAAGCLVAPATAAAAESTSAASNTPAVERVPVKRDAVLILAVSRLFNSRYTFRSVNLATGSFNALPSIDLVANIFRLGDEMKGGDEPDSGSSRGAIELLMANVPAGDYAVTQVYFANLYECLNESSVVVRLRPDTITIVSSGDVSPPEVFGRLPTNLDKARIFHVFDGARTNYPNLEGEAVNAEIIARIRWPRDSGGLFGKGCDGAEQFSTIQNETADTSAARAAALEEAQKNLARAKAGAALPRGAEQSAPSATTGKQK